MAAFAEDRGRRWEPFGVTEADFAAVPERDGVRVVSVLPGGGRGPGQAGWWLRAAAVALGVLAAAAAAVSWQAQYAMVWAVKQHRWVAAVEAGIPDVGAVIFAALGVALALHGRRAARPRALNAACIGISLAMNALAAGRGWRDLAIWVMPAGVYALASDTLIGVVRAWVLARARNTGETLADDGPTPLALAGGAALWLLRLVLDVPGTLRGFRAWVITDCPVAPGLRPGHLAQLEAVRREAGEQVTLATGQRDQAVGRAAAQAEQARGEGQRARAAETEVRGELDRVRADARQAIAQALNSAAREREELRARAERQADSLRAGGAQAREDAARLAGQVREDCAARVAGLEADRAGLREERDRLAAELRAVTRQPRQNGGPARDGQVLGADHPQTLTSRNNLAGAYRAAGDLGRAIPLLEQTLADRLRVLGADHPDTLTSRNNLAGAYQSAGDLGRAIPLYEQTLADQLRVLGADHPQTLTTRNNLAYTYRAAADVGRAIPLYEQSLADSVRVLGADHPQTLTTRNDLAGAYQAAGNVGRVIALYEQTLADCVRVLGADHSNTLTTRNNLAGAYQAAGDVGRAIPLFEQTLADCVRVLGAEHPQTKIVRGNLAAARQYPQ